MTVVGLLGPGLREKSARSFPVAGCWRVAGGLLAGCWRVAGGLLAGCWRVAGGLLADLF
jgi:hypothetical protein